jgi:molecular chaperone Hsp33
MIMPKNADRLLMAFCPSANIVLRHAEVTDSARELEHSHLCGPTAGLIQAEALAGVALLGAELTRPEEAVTLRLQVTGPIGGVLVEARSDGSLRGYTQVKVMNDLDACEDLDAAVALGDSAEVQVIRSLPGVLLSSAGVEVRPASVPQGIETYYRQSQQRRVRVQLTALAYGGFIDCARGVLIECLPDGDRAEFERIGRFVEDGTVQECLEAGASLQTICETVGVPDVQLAEPKPLRFHCPCSAERVSDMLGSMPTKELEEMICADQSVRVICHMCGKGYSVAVEELKRIVASRS